MALALVGLAYAPLVGLAGCRKSADQSDRKVPLVVADQPKLPEDPELGKRSTQQWSKHLSREEDERQGLFDRQRLEQHRKLMKQLTAARIQLDEQKGMQELNAALVSVRKQLDGVRAQLKQLDPWGNSSRLLPDYQALLEILSVRYPPAKQAAFGGNSEKVDAARMEFDAHLRNMNRWLDRIQHEEEDKGDDEG